MVNGSPWGSTLANTALRCAQAVLAGGHTVLAVFFQGEGVYNALSGGQADPGALDLARAWSQTAHAASCPLLLCSSASARRLPGSVQAGLSEPFRLAGLGELLVLMERADRVVSF